MRLGLHTRLKLGAEERYEEYHRNVWPEVLEANRRVGVTTAIAVLAHEIPHEVGDFAILLHAGFGTRRALLFNALSECAGLAGAFLAVVALYRVPTLSPYFLALAAASFIYVVMTDLLPDMHRGVVRVGAVWQVALLLAGILTVAIL